VRPFTPDALPTAELRSRIIMTDENGCIFCKLLSGELDASFVYRDGICSAFMDIQPVNAGHVLVIPNRHAAYLADLEAEEGAQMFRVAQRLSAAIRKSGVPCEGVNFFLADGEAAMQEIFHVHLHVFPRYAGDGFGLKFAPRYYQKPARSELNRVAESIRIAVEAAQYK
jgi:histidine triad (HIT) family protein